MPRLTLSGKIFMALATLLVVLLLLFSGFSIFGLQRGLGPYVAEIEIRRMDWLSQLLQKHYVANGNWNKLRNNDEAWRRFEMGETRDVQDGTGTLNNGDERRLPPWYARRFEGRPFDGGRREGPPDGSPGGNNGNTEMPDRGPMPQLDLLPRRFAPPPPPWFEPDPREPADSIYQRLGLVDAEGVRVAGAQVDAKTAARLPIKRGNVVIGYLVLAPLQSVDSEADRAFLARQSGVIAAIAVAGLAFALVLSWLLSRRWFKPIDALTQASRDVARGHLKTRVTVQGSDELAQLAKTFNDMAQRLDTVDATRRAWLADVAHELRTPLAAMRAEIEALQDGIRTFDERTALRLHRQVMRLGQLVDDLRASMQSPQDDPLTKAPAFPLALLKDALAQSRDRFGTCRISVDASAVDALAAKGQPMLEGDARRLHQVFMNLLANTLAYTESGGSLQIDAAIDASANASDASHASRLTLRFDDSAPGVPESELPHLFDRLFRGESSRNRALGGSGLGLSICRATVEAHGGTIDAEASPRGGLRIQLTLPLDASSPAIAP